LAQVISHEGELVTITDPTLLQVGRGLVGPVPYQVVIAMAATGAALILLRATSFGRYVLAVGGNRAAARLAGVPVRRTLVAVYVMSAELDAIAAVVVGGSALSGGRASIFGTVVGALIMQVIATTFNMMLVPYAWSLALKAGIILLAVYLQRPARA
jgi:ribose/xylose/arabinose/galactoside ABC-type transport system permease subunit